jgi:hypothetical protein
MRVYPPNQWDHAIDAAREYAASFGIAFLLDAGVGVTVGGWHERRRYPNLPVVARVEQTHEGFWQTQYLDYPTPQQIADADEREAQSRCDHDRQNAINEMYENAARGRKAREAAT